jgi:hypothetical protein
MCEICAEIDKRIQEYRRALKMTTDLLEIERIHLAIAALYRDRVRLHKTRNDRPSQLGRNGATVQAS